MLTTLPYATAEWTCLRCGAHHKIDVTDVVADDPDEYHGAAYGTFKVGNHTITWSSGSHGPLHYCVGGNIGFGVLIGFTRTEGPTP